MWIFNILLLTIAVYLNHKDFIENELLYLKGSIPGPKNADILVKKSVKNINKLTILEKIKVAEEAKKTPDKKKK